MSTDARSPQTDSAAASAAEAATGLDLARIMELMPHRYPFLLLDRVVEIERERIVALKNVTINEPFFQGHFPGRPVMPGVLIIEALAQAGCLMMANRLGRKRVMFMVGVDKARFKRPVVPGDVLELRVWTLKERGSVGRARGEAWVDGKLAAETEVLFADAPES